jgi:hypothetical protein
MINSLIRVLFPSPKKNRVITYLVKAKDLWHMRLLKNFGS